jgi:hypothetical protein
VHDPFDPVAVKVVVITGLAITAVPVEPLKNADGLHV